MPQMDQMTGGSWERASSNSTNTGVAAANWAEVRKVIYSNRAELGAACLALEDAKKQQDRKPVILISDSACFLSSSLKWTGEEKSPSMHGNPDADIMRDIIQLLRERIEQGLLTIFIKIKAHRGDPMNEQADRWADEGRQSENIRWSLPSNRPIFYWTDNGTTYWSPMNPTVKKELTYRYLNNN